MNDDCLNETTRKKTSEMDVLRNKVLNLLYMVILSKLILGYRDRGLNYKMRMFQNVAVDPLVK